MYRKRFFIILMSIILFASISVCLTVYLKHRSDVQYMDSEKVCGQNENVISRAMAAKMLALLYYSHDEITDMPDDTQYTDIKEDNWYNKYFYALDGLGVVWGESTCRPLDNLTCTEAEGLYNYFMQNIYGVTLEGPQAVSDQAGVVSEQAGTVTEPVSDEAVTSDAEYIDSERWMQLYDSMLQVDRTREMKREKVFLMSLIEADDGAWRISTDRGSFYFDGYAMDAYTNTSVEILTDGEEVVYIYGQTEGGTTLNSVLLTACNGGLISVFCNDTTAELKLSEEIGVNTSELAMPVVADITVDDGLVTDMSVYTDRINDRILSVTEAYIDMQLHGRLVFDENYNVYNISGEPETASNGDISVGYSVADAVVDPEGKVKAVLISGDIQPDNIRVAIMTSGHKSLYHSEVAITSETGFVVTGGSNSYEYNGGDTFTVNAADNMFNGSRLNVVPAAGGMLTVSSIRRSYGAPVYRGSIELALYDEGIVMINELPVEQYLYSVVPSEMPSEYGMEPLKAQAVCARGYAYMQINNCKLGYIGAHVDDSTAYQVYNNTRETDMSVSAVDATNGQVLQYDGKIISPYYFSTSCGSTADCSDVWIGMKHVPYLSGGIQNGEHPDIDLSGEDGIREFINNPPCDTYDSSFPWYRWSVKLYGTDIKKSLENAIKERYKANPGMILTKNKKGKYVSAKISGIGEIKSLKVAERAKSGIITALIIKGSKKTIKVISEYNIRVLLASPGMRITRNDNSTVDGLTILPSAFFYIESDSSGQEGYTLKGGGYGHGVGMSQNGAKAMSDSGCDYMGILGHYYSGCTVSAVSAS